MPNPMEEQVVVITGASSGIGLVTATEAARRGARVVLAARNEHDLASAAADITRTGGAALAVPTDVTSLWQMQRLAERAVEEFGRIDTWVNCAAVSAYATFEEQSLEDFRQVLEIGFMGQVNAAKVALPHLEQTQGAFICVGSLHSDRGFPLQTAYSAAKHALKGWLDGLRIELRRAGSPVRVTLIKPASINTPLFRKAKTQMEVEPKPIPPVYQPDLVAKAILDAAENSRRDVYVGRAGKFFAVAQRLSPRLVDWQQLRHGFASQKAGLAKDEADANNLYEAVGSDGGGYGEFGLERPAPGRNGSTRLWFSAATAGVAVAGAVGLMAWRRLSTHRRADMRVEGEQLEGVGRDRPGRENPAPEFHVGFDSASAD